MTTPSEQTAAAEQARKECHEGEYRETEDVESLRADAARWRYVRDNLAYSLQVDTEKKWFEFFFPPHPGATVTEVIDKMIAEQEGDK